MIPAKEQTRKYKRRPSRAREPFTDRAHPNTWLDTHLWHAKRMHMTNLWGFRLAERHSQSGLRAAYRAFAHSAVLHDASYHSALVLGAKRPTDKRVLHQILGDLGLAADVALAREQLFLATHPGSGEVLGPVRVLCMSTGAEGDCGRRFLLCAHASFAEALEAVLRECVASEAGLFVSRWDRDLFRFQVPLMCPWDERVRVRGGGSLP